MIHTAIFGAGGRMGGLIRSAADEDIEIVQLFDQGSSLQLDPEVDVLVDFSLPAAWDSLDVLLQNSRAALVSGTTGLHERQLGLLEKWSSERPVFYSSNMSIGVYVLDKLMKQAELLLDGSFDRELIEFHHRGKLDSPSGTALSLLGNWPENTPAHSIRGGDITGEHHLHYMGQGERLVFSHIATDRKIFANGAIRAVKFISRKSQPGLYGMGDMLG